MFDWQQLNIHCDLGDREWSVLLIRFHSSLILLMAAYRDLQAIFQRCDTCNLELGFNGQIGAKFGS